MSGNLGLYSLLFFTADGTLLAEEHQLTMRRTAGSQRVFTVAKGFAGLSPGSPLVEGTCANAIPTGGFEFDMGKKILGLIPVDVGVLLGSVLSAKGKAFVEHDSIEHGVNREANYSFEFVMPFTLFT